MRKKQWKDLVGLHNFLSNEITKEDYESKEIAKQLDGDVSALSQEQVSQLSDKAAVKEAFVEDGLKVIKLIEPNIKKYNRLRRYIVTTNAISIADKKNNKVLQSDEQGNFLYSIQGKLKMEDEIEDLLDTEIEFEPLVINENNKFLNNKQISKVLKDFI
jgi:cell division protein FtsI/penicillin-binding protein 2